MPDYQLIIRPREDGGYAAELRSGEGDLWAAVTQDPQQGDQFRESLLAFAERFGIPVVTTGERQDGAAA